MFEELIATLEDIGVEYNEDYENGTLTIMIGDIDKATLVQIISALNDQGFTYNISDADIVVESAGAGPEMEAPAEETAGEDYMAALDQLQ